MLLYDSKLEAEYVEIPACDKCKLTGKNPMYEMDECPLYLYDEEGWTCMPDDCENYVKEY